jgi:hypothetical protein
MLTVRKPLEQAIKEAEEDEVVHIVSQMVTHPLDQDLEVFDDIPWGATDGDSLFGDTDFHESMPVAADEDQETAISSQGLKRGRSEDALSGANLESNSPPRMHKREKTEAGQQSSLPLHSRKPSPLKLRLILRGF